MSVMRHYETLLRLSEKMAELARTQDWETLAAVEVQRTALIPQLPKDVSVLAPEEQAEIATTIAQIKAYDSEVLEYVMPWREQVSLLLDRLAPRV